MIPTRLEPLGLSHNDNKRPDGQTLVPRKRGRCLTWDASCVHRLANSWIACLSSARTAAADTAEQRKIDKYRDLADTLLFQPVLVETLGGFGKVSYKFLAELGRRFRDVSGDLNASRHLRERITVAIQKGNAA